VRSGAGLGFSYRDYLTREIKRGELKVLKIEGFTNKYQQFIVYPKDRPLSEAAEKYLAVLRQKNKKSRRNPPSRPISPK
jgi:hypothetical protein